ncbi:MAG TPA: hypothetical protein VGD92_08450 [Sphingobacteriaceae bacterium]
MLTDPVFDAAREAEPDGLRPGFRKTKPGYQALTWRIYQKNPEYCLPGPRGTRLNPKEQ